MKIVSWNVNGLRSVYKKGFLKWLEKTNADIICLQEIKAQENQLPPEIIQIAGYHAFFNSAGKKGYSGVGIYTREKPLEISSKIDFTRFDDEGRVLSLIYNKFVLINAYLPHGGRLKENLDYKLSAYARLFDFLRQFQDKEIVLIGDFNIAHQEIDLARPKQNENNTMFTPAERKLIDDLIDLGFTDTFRHFHKEGGNYTWLSYRKNAREKGLGWRIDYAFISPGLRSSLESAFILSEVEGSDHCPIGLSLGKERL